VLEAAVLEQKVAVQELVGQVAVVMERQEALGLRALVQSILALEAEAVEMVILVAPAVLEL